MYGLFTANCLGQKLLKVAIASFKLILLTHVCLATNLVLIANELEVLNRYLNNCAVFYPHKFIYEFLVSTSGLYLVFKVVDISNTFINFSGL